MSEPPSYNFNKILRKIIKNSLFTERQLEIILNFKNIQEIEFTISRGAYFRQVAQTRRKLIRLYNSIIILQSLGIILPDDFDVMLRLSEQLSIVQNSDVFPEQEQKVIDVIDTVVRKTVNM